MSLQISDNTAIRIETDQAVPGKEIRRILPLPILLVFAIVLHIYLPNQIEQPADSQFSYLIAFFLFITVVLSVLSIYNHRLSQWLNGISPLLSLVTFLLIIWEVVTQKFNLLPMPFFPSPVKILEALTNDSGVLAISTLHSLRLLIIGYLIGTFVGLITGILLGWYQKFRYWVNPFLRLIGPIPATAWIPVVLVVFPSSFSASIFLIALSTWFSVSVMTWTGIASVNNSYFEVAKTLGADEKYLIFRVAIPSAFPSIFVGLFMGLGVSFVTLIVAEMIGVKAGLGWYIQWAQGWAEYYKVYAALFIMAVLFSAILTVFFKIRDRILIYQKGLIKW